MCKTWTQMWADHAAELKAGGITVQIILGQKEEYVGWARRDWKGVPEEWFLSDEKLTVCHAVKGAGVADIVISPHSWPAQILQSSASD